MTTQQTIFIQIDSTGNVQPDQAQTMEAVPPRSRRSTFNSGRTIRRIAIALLVTGLLLVFLEVANQLLSENADYFPVFTGLWVGLVFISNGILGWMCALRETRRLIMAYMVFCSIVALLVAPAGLGLCVVSALKSLAYCKKHYPQYMPDLRNSGLQQLPRNISQSSHLEGIYNNIEYAQYLCNLNWPELFWLLPVTMGILCFMAIVLCLWGAVICCLYICPCCDKPARPRPDSLIVYLPVDPETRLVRSGSFRVVTPVQHRRRPQTAAEPCMPRADEPPPYSSLPDGLDACYPSSPLGPNGNWNS